MIDEILPAAVSTAESFGDPPGILLHPEELSAVADAVDKRRREFTTGRYCARQALSRFGLGSAALPPSPTGPPVWPAGFTGSITHCDGYRAAVAVHLSAAYSVGIDAEPNAPLPDGVLDVIGLDLEVTRTRQLASVEPETHWDRVLFTAKEAVYKAWYPLGRRMLDFSEVEVGFDPVARRFHAIVADAVPLPDGRECDRFTGRWLVRDGLIVSAVCVTVPCTHLFEGPAGIPTIAAV